MGGKKRLFVIDAMAMAFRNYHAFGVRPLKTTTGIPTSAVYGSAIFLLKLLEEEKPDFVVVATDSREATFRHELYQDYKANRKEMPADLAAQLPYFFQLFAALGIPLLRQSGVEADDLIGSLVTQVSGPELHCYIVSGDKDFMQVVGEHVSIYSPKKGETAQIITPKEVFERFSCTPAQVTDILALIGDTSDNVPGISGVGEKGAAKLIANFQSLENIYSHLSEVANPRMRTSLEEGQQKVFLSRQLVTLKKDLLLPYTLEELANQWPQCLTSKQLLHLFHELEFRTLAEKIDKLLSKHSDTVQAVAVASSSTDSLGKEYLVANTPETFRQMCETLAAAPSFAFDSETSGLDIISDGAIGLSFSCCEGRGWYLPLLEHQLEGLGVSAIVTGLEKIFADPRSTKIAHNLKFDLQMLKNLKLEIKGPLQDTMIMAYLANSVAKEHGIDYSALEYLDFRKIPTAALMGSDYQTNMNQVPLEKIALYGIEDADITYRLAQKLLPLIKEQGQENVFSQIEMPLVPILAQMERTGVFVDVDTLSEISQHLASEANRLEAIIHSLAGESFNINSTKQLQVILFEKLKVHETLGVKRLKKTKTGYSTDVSVLELLAEHPFAEAILDYRTVTKLKNTYVDALPQLIHSETGRIHTSFHQTGTATGRLSSSDPNLQNIPIRSTLGREIRKAFKPKEKDWVIITADYSQIELRLLAHIADDPELLGAFRSGADIHTATASSIFGVPIPQVDGRLRSQAKAINFGIIYGMGPQRLARQTGVSMAEARDFIEKYFNQFPRIRDYIQASIDAARQKGYSTTMSGRRRPIPELQARERMLVVAGENIAVNSPLQGSAADLVKLAMIDVQKKLDGSGLSARMLLQVHDELVFECPRAEAEATAALIKETMETAQQLHVPLTVETGVGANWLEAD